MVEVKLKALIVDDEASIGESLRGVLEDEGWSVAVELNGLAGVRSFLEHSPDLVLLDVWMEGIDGIETLQRMRSYRADVPIVIMSGHATIETAVRATKLGATEVLEKPLSLAKIIPILEGVKKSPARTSSGKARFLIGESKKMNELRALIERIAPKNAWVLIEGENGTGKEVAAQQIHSLSTRSDAPFVAVNCAAIPEELIESELFGHEKGAFTHAVARKKGKFELADGGTLFLDEIGDMSLRTQAKVLRALQDQKFERVGGKDTLSVDVRVIAATNKVLEKEIEAGNFREDLYFRLKVIPIEMPALRARERDVVTLAKYFLAQNALELGEPEKTLSDAVEEQFCRYDWPGNVRELKNLVERLCIVGNGNKIEMSDLPDNIVRTTAKKNSESFQAEGFISQNLKDARYEFEKNYIQNKLEENGWNISKTSEVIGVERSHLHRKMKSLGIEQVSDSTKTTEDEKRGVDDER